MTPHTHHRAGWSCLLALSFISLTIAAPRAWGEPSTDRAAAVGAAMDFVDVTQIIPGIQLDLRYATPKNFLKRAVYPEPLCLLRRAVAERLARVQIRLALRGYGLKIWDAYRPLAVQKEMWALVPDERYVASPIKGSRHNRGAAVDCTLVDRDGVELEMPTAFDDFSARATASGKGATAKARANLAILQEAMRAGGFEVLDTEWWHFDCKGWEAFEVSDESLSEVSSSKAGEDGALMTLQIPLITRQLLVSVSDDWSATSGVLARFERSRAGAPWLQLDETIPVMLGRAGMAWGTGIHKLSGNARGPRKKEGDGRCPAGAFFLLSAFGYDAVPAKAQHPYRKMAARHVGVDDPRSRYYNRIIDGTVHQKDWSSFEIMRRNDERYRLGIVVQHNWQQTPEGGSCIFMHVWGGPGVTTAGCTAMTHENMTETYEWLKADEFPVLVQMPRGEYERVRSTENLPALSTQ